jgi:hypothetical protein
MSLRNLTASRAFGAPLRLLGIFVLLAHLAGCSGPGLKAADEGVVIADKVDVLNSTALVATRIGQLQKGDAVSIVNRATVNGVDFVKVERPNSDFKPGWIESRTLISRRLLDQCRDLAKIEAETPAQVTGKLKQTGNLRVKPGRDSEVVTILKSGTTFDILKRVRTDYRPPAAPSPAQAAESAPEEQSGPRYDYWYLARFPVESVYQVGWLYSGSVEIVQPDAIAGLVGPGRRTAAAIAFGGSLDKTGTLQKNFLIADKQIFNSDAESDFDRIYVITWDQQNETYVQAFAETNIRGVSPVLYKTESDAHTVFTISTLTKTGAAVVTGYEANLVENRLRVTRAKR